MHRAFTLWEDEAIHPPINLLFRRDNLTEKSEILSNGKMMGG
jgi:hypothetical protein